MTTMIESLVALLSMGGTSAASRVFPLVAPDAVVRPYIVYQRITSNDENVMSGVSGLYNTRMQIDAYADTYMGAISLASQIDVLMVGWSTQNVSLGQQDLYESDVKLFRIEVDYSIWHT